MKSRTMLLLIVLIIFSFWTTDTSTSSGNEETASKKVLEDLLLHLNGIRLVSKNDLIKKGVMFESDEDIETYGCGLLCIENDFNNDGKKDVAICGVYYSTSARKEIPFLLIASKQSNGKYRKDFYKEFDHFFFMCKESEFTQFKTNEVLRIGFKAQSDLGGSILWRNKKYVFEYHISP